LRTTRPTGIGTVSTTVDWPLPLMVRRVAPNRRGRGDRPSSVPSLAPRISTGAARTFPQDLHNWPGGRADRPTAVPGGGAKGIRLSARTSFPCLATFHVDEAPALVRSSEDHRSYLPEDTYLVDGPKVESMAIAIP
jgi:hypothetical protein